MFSILFRHPAPEQEDYLIAELAEFGTTGITEEAGGIRAFFDASADAQRYSVASPSLLPNFAGRMPSIGSKYPRRLAAASHRGPLLSGSALAQKRSHPAGPHSARDRSGDGVRHRPAPATQLCLQAIERHVRPGDAVLDIGSGSGILAQAATLMGAGSVIGCDCDPEAVQIARENYPSVLFFTGSAEAVRSRSAGVIVANIDSATLEQLAPELERVRKPHSTLILSGFRSDDVPEGFEAAETLQQGDWLCLIDAR